MPEKVVLAYSGGLDTSIIIPWLKENYSYNVIAMVGDVGQGDDIEAVVEKAYATGASKVIVEDLREEFLTGYVFPALRAGRIPPAIVGRSCAPAKSSPVKETWLDEMEHVTRSLCAQPRSV